MRIVLSPTEWREKLISFSQDQFNSPDKVNTDDEASDHDETSDDDQTLDDDQTSDDDQTLDYDEASDDDQTWYYDETSSYGEHSKIIKKKLAEQYDMRMTQMRPLFAGLPQFEKICKNRNNKFVDSCCKKYILEFDEEKKDEDKDIDEVDNQCVYEFFNKSHEKVIDLKYMINLCGYILTSLDVDDYPFSEIVPLINNNCPNVEALYLTFKEINSQDFTNVFSNMSHLKSLSITWQCEYSTLPISLVESLEQVGGTLEDFFLESSLTENNCLPHLLTSVILGFVGLKKLLLHGFEPNQPLLEAIGQLQNLNYLSFLYDWKEYQMVKNKINMYPIGNLKNLKNLSIYFDYGVTDELLINLSNNAKKLNYLYAITTHITDVGKNAFKDFKKLMLNLHESYKK